MSRLTFRARLFLTTVSAALVAALIGARFASDSPSLRGTAFALAISASIGAILSWLMTAELAGRVRRITAVARRYGSGDLTPAASGYADDELGTVARALDEAVQELGTRLAERERDWARMQAVLGGMIEGVIVVDAHGRLRLANE